MRKTKVDSAYWGKAKNGTWHKFAIDQAPDVAACNGSMVLEAGTMTFTVRLPFDEKICKLCAKNHTFPPLKIEE